jgi:hypothetical protein
VAYRLMLVPENLPHKSGKKNKKKIEKIKKIEKN